MLARSDAMDDCFYGSRLTDKLSDSNYNVFGPDINGVANPMMYTIRGQLPVSMDMC